MGKFLIIAFFIILGLGTICLSALKDSLICSNYTNRCSLDSYIYSYNVSSYTFPVSDINRAYCKKVTQPSRSGEKNYHLMVIETFSGREFNLGTYKKLSQCKDSLKPIKAFIDKKSPTLEYNSGNGFVNSLGFAFGIVMLFIAFIIFTSEPEEKHYDWEDEDENKDSLSKDSSDNAE